MGALDDAIREHLELKRQHGASEQEIRQAEAEALGPARREPGADAFGEDAGLAAVPEAFEPPPLPGDAVEDAPPPPLPSDAVEDAPPPPPPDPVPLDPATLHAVPAEPAPVEP